MTRLVSNGLHPRAIDAAGLPDGQYAFEVVDGKVVDFIQPVRIVYVPAGSTAADVPPGTSDKSLIIEEG